MVKRWFLMGVTAVVALTTLAATPASARHHGRYWHHRYVRYYRRSSFYSVPSYYSAPIYYSAPVYYNPPVYYDSEPVYSGVYPYDYPAGSVYYSRHRYHRWYRPYSPVYYSSGYRRVSTRHYVAYSRPMARPGRHEHSGRHHWR